MLVKAEKPTNWHGLSLTICDHKDGCRCVALGLSAKMFDFFLIFAEKGEFYLDSRFLIGCIHGVTAVCRGYLECFFLTQRITKVAEVHRGIHIFSPLRTSATFVILCVKK